MLGIHASRPFTLLRSPFTRIASITLALAACSDQTAPVDTIDESVDGIAEIQDLPEFHRGWGDGNPIVRLALARTVITTVPEGHPVYQPFSGARTHTFVAYQRREDGTDARGWTRLVQRGATAADQSFRTRGRVVCMNKSEEANVLLIADETNERSGDPATGFPPFPAPQEGDEGTFWAIRDNGSGPHADPDQTTLRIATTAGVAKGLCENPPDFLLALAEVFLLPIEGGFIKVID